MRPESSPSTCEGGAGAVVIEVHQDVVEDDGHRIAVLGVSLEGGDAQREVELVARAVAHRLDPDVGAACAHAAQNRLVVVIEVRAEAGERSQGEPPKSSLARVRMGPWFFCR